jgi:hypothetical protein
MLLTRAARRGGVTFTECLRSSSVRGVTLVGLNARGGIEGMRGSSNRRWRRRTALGAITALAVGVLASVAAAISSSGAPAAAAQYAEKVTICHHTHSQKHPFVTITVSRNALPAHLRHGDTVGPCPPVAATMTPRSHGKSGQHGKKSEKAKAPTRISRAHSGTEAQAKSSHGRSGTAPGHAGTSPGPSGNTPGQGRSAPGRSDTPSAPVGSTPGDSSTAPGHSATAPGHSSTAPGRSGSAPGHSGTAPGHAGSPPGHSGTAPGDGGTPPGQGKK